MTPLSTVLSYHDRTKHDFRRYAASLGYMDWDNQPHPFRYYEGTEVTPLEIPREVADTPYELIYAPNTIRPVPVTLRSISEFFYYAMSLSAWKSTGEKRWALRVNPSSGNLHPTESYLLLKSPDGDPAAPVLYHYQAENHSLERRASFSSRMGESVMDRLADGSFLIGLSSIMWREAWKYGERAFRYCQHDIGHAVAALRFSAGLCGWQLMLVPHWPTEAIARLLGLHRQQDFLPTEHEEAELVALVVPSQDLSLPSSLLPAADEDFFAEMDSATWYGCANHLSSEHVAWPVIGEVTEATQSTPGQEWNKEREAGTNWSFPVTPTFEAHAQQIIRQRRSCLSLDGVSTVTRDIFLRILRRTLPGPHPPWNALGWSPKIHLVLFVHRVDDLPPGLYCLPRDPASLESLQQAMHQSFMWSTPDGVPDGLPLYLLEEGDNCDKARSVSCHQDIAADGFFSLAMIAEFEETLQHHGSSFYRNLFWETGMIGQVLYLEAEAAGARSTGIGCYFDNPMHKILGLQGHRFQDLYHFTVGMHVEDSRLQSWDPYATTQ